MAALGRSVNRSRGRGNLPVGITRWRRLAIYTSALLTSLALLLCVASSASAISFGVGWRNLVPSELEGAQKAGASVFRMPLDLSRSTGGNWAEYDAMFKEAWERGITIQPYLVRSDQGMNRFLTSADAGWAAWYSWSKEVVERYGHNGKFWEGKSNPRPVDAWEVWNEPNLPENNPVCKDKNGNPYNCVLPQAYGNFLIYTSAAIQAGAQARTGSNTQVLFGGLYMPGGENFNSFLEGAYSVAGVAASHVGVSIHPYSFLGSVANKINGMAQEINDVRYALDHHVTGGGSKSLWVTEIGWPVAGYSEGLEAFPPNSEAQQAQLLTESFNWIKGTAAAYNIQNVIWYNVRDIDGAPRWDGWCGLRRAGDGSFRSSWWAFQKQTGASVWPGPYVTTEGVTGSSGATVTVSGKVNPAGYKTTFYFEYGTTTAYGDITSIGTSEAEEATTMSAMLYVQPGTTYHYRLVASHVGGTSYGEDRTFSVPGYRYMRGLSNGSTVTSWSAMADQGLPSESLSADFDGDGKADIVKVEFEAGANYRYRVGTSNGSGISSWSTVLVGMGQPYKVNVADFTGDGKADIVAAESEGSGKYRFMLGTGNGTGIASWKQIMSGMGAPERMSLADFTGDGKADIVAAESEGNGKYRFMLGTSNGTGVASWNQLMSGMSLATTMNVADFTADSKADIVVAESEGGGKYRFMLGTSNGTGVASWNQLMSGMGPPFRMNVADFTGDGKADLVAAESEGSGKYRFMLGTGNGSGVASWTQLMSGMGTPNKMNVADFTGDGKADIVSIETHPSGAMQYRVGVSGGTSVSSWQAIQTWMSTPTAADVGDVDGDGKADIVGFESEISGEEGAGSPYRYTFGISSGSLAVSSWKGVLGGMGMVYGMDIAKFTADSKADIVVAESEGGGKYRFMLGTSNGTGVASWNQLMSGMGAPYKMNVADLTGDGKADIVVAESEGGGKYRFMLGTSNGTGVASWNQIMSGMGAPYQMRVADLTGDGKADIVVAESEGGGKYRYMLGTSSGTGIASWKQILSGMGAPERMSLGDFSGDGKADIVAAESEGNGKYRFMLGTSSGTGIASWSQVMSGMGLPRSFGADDVDGDGKADIVAAEKYS